MKTNLELFEEKEFYATFKEEPIKRCIIGQRLKYQIYGYEFFIIQFDVFYSICELKTGANCYRVVSDVGEEYKKNAISGFIDFVEDKSQKAFKKATSKMAKTLKEFGIDIPIN